MDDHPTGSSFGAQSEEAPESGLRSRGGRGARLLVIRDVGHVAQMEQPGTVARAVLALLDDTPEVLSTRP